MVPSPFRGTATSGKRSFGVEQPPLVLPRLPRPPPRQEPRNVVAILPVGGPEPLGQKWLLEQGNVDRIDPEKNQGPLEMRPRQEHRRLAEEHQDDPRDHRIAHVAVGTPNDQPSGWIPGGQCAPAVADKAPQAGAEQQYPDAQQPEPASLQGDLGQTGAGGQDDPVATCQPDGDEY